MTNADVEEERGEGGGKGGDVIQIKREIRQINKFSESKNLGSSC